MIGSGSGVGAVRVAPAEAIQALGCVIGFGRGAVAGGGDEVRVGGISDFAAVDGEGAEVDLMSGVFVGGAGRGGAHGEGAGGHGDRIDGFGGVEEII